MARLLEIKALEGVKMEDAALDRLISLTGGDMRQAITFMQSAHRLHDGELITSADIEEIAGVVPTATLEQFITVAKSNSFEKVQAAVVNMIADGFSANSFLSQIHDMIVVMPAEECTDKQKSLIAVKIAKSDHALVDGADEYLQLMDVASVIMTGLCDKE